MKNIYIRPNKATNLGKGSIALLYHSMTWDMLKYPISATPHAQVLLKYCRIRHSTTQDMLRSRRTTIRSDDTSIINFKKLR